MRILVAARLIALAGSASSLQLIPSEQWRGPAFLNEVWDLSWEKEEDLKYDPADSSADLESPFHRALHTCLEGVRRGKA